MQETRVGLAGRADGRETQDWPASIVATDPSHDLAVLRIEAPREALQPVRLGTSNDLKVGQSLYAIGFPYGLSRTLTAGVVSGLNREIPNPAGSKTQGAIQVKPPASPPMSPLSRCASITIHDSHALKVQSKYCPKYCKNLNLKHELGHV